MLSWLMMLLISGLYLLLFRVSRGSLIWPYRMNQTMTRLLKMKEDEYSSFVRVLFGLTTPSPVAADLEKEMKLEWIDPSLNESQKDAIRFALASREVALIHGPPGVSLPFGTTNRLSNIGTRLAKPTH